MSQKQYSGGDRFQSAFWLPLVSFGEVSKDSELMIMGLHGMFEGYKGITRGQVTGLLWVS